MPFYALICPACRHAYEDFARARDRYSIACPRCKHAPCETDYSAQTIVVDRILVGRQAMLIGDGCTPEEVPEARKLFGDTVEIDDEGNWSVTSREQQRRFRKRKAALLDKARQRRQVLDEVAAERSRKSPKPDDDDED